MNIETIQKMSAMAAIVGTLWQRPTLPRALPPLGRPFGFNPT